jgi:hypothetical protein
MARVVLWPRNIISVNGSGAIRDSLMTSSGVERFGLDLCMLITSDRIEAGTLRQTHTDG